MSDPPLSNINLNTILLAIGLGVMSWVGYTTQQTAVAIAVIVNKSDAQERELLDLRARMLSVEIELARIKRL